MNLNSQWLFGLNFNHVLELYSALGACHLRSLFCSRSLSGPHYLLYLRSQPTVARQHLGHIFRCIQT